ncbi:hypothetical protein NDU88_006842 [Pleurodeles waltl]|uniref:Uncharacterized protein n=1 Tax=Pleurodeles waltl TaxID=8319 RepID=A0AAV7UQT2_PLEWA|nr:hypothetical protein NDU88_006842 [Pleurodeles waltl]
MRRAAYIWSNRGADAYDQPEELYAYGQPEELYAYGQPEELHAYGQAGDLHPYGHPEELHAYCQLEELHTYSQPEEMHASLARRSLALAWKSQLGPVFEALTRDVSAWARAEECILRKEEAQGLRKRPKAGLWVEILERCEHLDQTDLEE